jgi:UDP-arabinose 4-epimerase
MNPNTRLVVAPGKMHIAVTGGAGFIGSHATLHLLDLGHTVTVIDNLSRGNLGALQQIASLHAPQFFKFYQADLGNLEALSGIFLEAQPAVDLIMHFAAIAYVGESVAQPLLYYHNITSNTINLLEAMKAAKVTKVR